MLAGFSFGAGRASKKAGSAWAPNNASVALRAWYRSDLGVSLSGSNVTAWADQSGAGDANRNQAGVGGSEPTFTASNASYNNRPSVDANGSKAMSVPGAWSTAPFSGAMSLVVIGHGALGSAFLSDAAGSDKLFWSRSGNGAEFYSVGVRLTSGVDVTTPKAMLVIDDKTGGGAAARIYVNNFTTAALSTTTVITDSLSKMTLVTANSGVTNLNGSLAEVILYGGVLTATDISNLRTYLNGLYNLGIT